MKLKTPLLLAGLVAFGGTSVSAQTVVLRDAFDSDTSANYTVTTQAGDDVITTFGVDTTTLNLSDGSTAVPESPNFTAGDVANSALLTQVNTAAAGGSNASIATIFASSLTPLSGDHRVTVDFLGRLTTASGSTEVAAIGVLGTTGTVARIAGSVSGETSPASSGYYGMINPDYGWSSGDIGFLEGGLGDAEQDPANPEFGWGLTGPQPSSITLTNPDGPWEAETSLPTSTSISGEVNFGEALFETVGGTPGTGVYSPLLGFSDGEPAGEWFSLRMTFIDGIAVYEVKPVNEPDWEVISTYDDPDDSFTSGLPFISHEDAFAGSANDDQFYLWDNLVVEDLSTPGSVRTWNMY